ncbi:MFS transporter [bacterium]|nr:MFS transporter [candidate division CSSED10-310 bacterium]
MKSAESALRKTLRLSIGEGVFAQIYASMAAPGSMFITKFAVLLGATPFQFAILSAIGQISQIFQPLGALFTKKMTSRRRFVVKLTAWGRFLAVCYGIPALVMSHDKAMELFLFLFFIATTFQAISGNAWIAWISDIVPFKIRGRFFSWRSRYLLVAGLVTGYLLGGIVDLFDSGRSGITGYLKDLAGLADRFPAQFPPVGFLGIFALAALAGVIGLILLNRQPEMPKSVENISSWQMLSEPFKDKNFRWLLVYGSWWMLAVGVGSPFWQPFMIQKLHMSLIDMQIYGTISTIASFTVLKAWGSLIDRVGNKTAMKIAILLSGMNAIIWVFATPETYWLIYLEAASSGVMWSGAGIIAMNFVLAVAPDGKRQIYSGIFGAVSGVAMMITMLLSGAYLPDPVKMGHFSLESEQVLFGISGLLRWTTLIPLAWISEPKSSPLGLAFAYLFHYAKVKVVQLTTRIIAPRF